MLNWPMATLSPGAAGGNRWCHPYFPPQKTDDLFSCLLAFRTFRRRLSNVLSKFSHKNWVGCHRLLTPLKLTNRIIKCAYHRTVGLGLYSVNMRVVGDGSTTRVVTSRPRQTHAPPSSWRTTLGWLRSRFWPASFRPASVLQTCHSRKLPHLS